MRRRVLRALLRAAPRRSASTSAAAPTRTPGGVPATVVNNPELAARALEIPVVGLDFMVRDAEQPDYVIIEANERAGLANHEPQPTAERFVDLLFPHSRPLA